MVETEEFVLSENSLKRLIWHVKSKLANLPRSAYLALPVSYPCEATPLPDDFVIPDAPVVYAANNTTGYMLCLNKTNDRYSNSFYFFDGVNKITVVISTNARTYKITHEKVIFESSDEITKLNRYPNLSDVQLHTGSVWALCYGEYVEICPSDKSIVVQSNATAASLALKSIQQGRLILTGADEKMIEEVHELLGDELFNELAAANVQTMELKPQLTMEEKIEKAKAAYYEQKAAIEAQKQKMLEMKQREEADDVASKDVEPLNSDTL